MVVVLVGFISFSFSVLKIPPLNLGRCQSWLPHRKHLEKVLHFYSEIKRSMVALLREHYSLQRNGQYVCWKSDFPCLLVDVSEYSPTNLPHINNTLSAIHVPSSISICIFFESNMHPKNGNGFY